MWGGSFYTPSPLDRVIGFIPPWGLPFHYYWITTFTIVMKTTTKLAVVLLLCATNAMSYFLGSNEIVICRNENQKVELLQINTREALGYERELSNALFEGLHRFYSNDDNDFWFEVFMQTEEYHHIDSLLNGDWEDFYYYETPKLEWDY